MISLREFYILYIPIFVGEPQWTPPYVWFHPTAGWFLMVLDVFRVRATRPYQPLATPKIDKKKRNLKLMGRHHQCHTLETLCGIILGTQKMLGHFTSKHCEDLGVIIPVLCGKSVIAISFPSCMWKIASWIWPITCHKPRTKRGTRILLLCLIMTSPLPASISLCLYL
jgi:hypothetical protein